MNNITKKVSGFTLFELIIVMVITGIIVAGSSNILAQGFRSFVYARNIMEENWQTLIATETMLRDLRAIRSTTDITTATSTNITYNDVSGKVITFDINDSMLRRTENGVSQDVASDLANLTFQYYDENGTIISDTSTPSQREQIRYVIMDFGPNKPQAAIYPWNLH